MKIFDVHQPARRLDIYLLYLVTVIALPFYFPDCLRAAEKTVDPFYGLRQRLVRDGFDVNTLNRYYTNPKVVFESRAVGRYFQHQESALNYDQFLSRTSLRKARQYMKQYDYWLERAETEYQVDKEIITAILLVETRLGTFVGNASTFNILSSMAALSDPEIREMLWRSLPEKKKLSREDYLKKAARKSQWAYSELTAFLTYIDREKIPVPVEVPGSYAGAVGIAQFMPSNLLSLAVDGDKNGRADLFTHADAIFSVANYLRHHGWKPGMTPEESRKVLFAYNHSSYYVDTLMKLYRALEEKK